MKKYNPQDLRLGKSLLHLIPKAQFMRGNTDKLDFIQILKKSFIMWMSLFKTDENTAIEWAKIFTKPIFNKGLVSKVYKEFSKLIIKKKKQRIP